MQIAYQDHPVLLSPSKWLRGELRPASWAPGYYTIIQLDGRQFSMQPGGVYGSRAGTDGDGNGPWEQCKRTGNVLLFSVGDEDHAVLMAER